MLRIPRKKVLKPKSLCFWAAVCFFVIFLEYEGIRHKVLQIFVEKAAETRPQRLPKCSPLKRGNVFKDATYEPNYGNVTWEAVLSTNPQVKLGGSYQPSHCEPTSTLAIIIPFRDRHQHLTVLLNNLHSLMQDQNQAYTVFVVHQKAANMGVLGRFWLIMLIFPFVGEDDLKFNRGMLRNVGFLEAKRQGSFDCFIFHDVDLIPENAKNIYHCSAVPLHLCPYAANRLDHMAAESLFGGVIAVTEDVFTAANGYSNKYWAWGAEDDDLYKRLDYLGYGILRMPKEVGRYRMLPHLKEDRNPKRDELLSSWRSRASLDGLKDIKYQLIGVIKRRLFTEILVSLPSPSTDN